jgi:archaellum biogenesis protein FlaJ (TadC family)
MKNWNWKEWNFINVCLGIGVGAVIAYIGQYLFNIPFLSTFSYAIVGLVAGGIMTFAKKNKK